MTTNRTLNDILDDVWDTRDLIELYETLETELMGEYLEKATNDQEFSEWLESTPNELHTDLKQVLSVLEELKGNGGDEQWRGDWYPVTMIAEHYFTDYAEELLKDCGDLPQEIPHYIEIDWEATADNIKVDYSAIEIDGTTYYFR